MGLPYKVTLVAARPTQAGRCPWCRWGHVLLSNWIGPADPQTALELQGIRYGSRDLPGEHGEGSDGDEGGGHYPLQAYLPEEPLLPPSGDMIVGECICRFCQFDVSAQPFPVSVTAAQQLLGPPAFRTQC